MTVAVDARLVAGQSTGDSTYWTGLLHGIANISSDFRFVLFSNAERPQGIPWSEQFEWRTVPAQSARFWSLVKFPLAARKARAKVIHAQYSLSPLVGRYGITTIHDVSFLICPDWFPVRDRALLTLTVPQSARRAAAVITVSETSRGEIERLIPYARGKTSATPLACPPWIRPVANAEATLNHKLGLQPGYLLTVGTRWPRKNMNLAVQACEQLSGVRTLVVTGKTGWGEKQPSRVVKEVGYVDSETLSALYSAASLYLAPSLHEGFGLPLLEAFTCGCPVVCSSGGALPEVAGDAAIVMKTWEPKDWSDAIDRTLSDSSKLKSLRESGFRRTADFSWEETARRTMEVYRRVIG